MPVIMPHAPAPTDLPRLSLPVKWWIVTGVATVFAAGSWLLARSRMPGGWRGT